MSILNKDLHAIRGKYYISRLIEEGEHEHQDFKFRISDARKIARSISAFANNDGGCLLVGVKDNGVVAGIRSEEDIYMIEAAAEIYCRPAVEVEMRTFRCDGGAVVLRAGIRRAERRPVECRDDDDRWRAYYRVADENILAHPLMVRAWRQQSSPRPGAALCGAEGSLLTGALAARGHASVEELMVDCHLSRSTAEEALTALISAGIVGFEYYHPVFRLILKENTQSNG